MVEANSVSLKTQGIFAKSTYFGNNRYGPFKSGKREGSAGYAKGARLDPEIVGTIIETWNDLSTLEKESWNKRAMVYGFTPYNAYMQLNLKRAMQGKTICRTPTTGD